MKSNSQEGQHQHNMQKQARTSHENVDDTENINNENILKKKKKKEKKKNLT